MRIAAVSIAISSILFGYTAVAAEPADAELGTVEIIGQRVPVALPLTVDTVDAAELAEKHRDDLAQALELVPGVNLQNVGQRRERLIYVRGFNSRQVPLFIDGVPVYVPYDGNVDLARFGVEYVSEVRVGKGLASLLYGPNILGGAVNVVSRKPTEPFSLNTRISTELDSEFGSNLQRAAIGIAGSNDRWYGTFNASGSDSDGYRLPGSFVPSAGREDGGRRENAETKDRLYVARVGFTPDEDSEYSFTYYRQEGEKDDPPYAGTAGPARFWQWPWWNKESFSLVSRNAVSEQGTLRLRAYYDIFKNSLNAFTNAAGTASMFQGSRYDDYSVGGGADFEWQWSPESTTRLAAHYKYDVHRDQQRQPALPLQRLAIPTYDIAIEHEWLITPDVSLTPSYQHVIQAGRTVQVYGAGQFSPVTVQESTADNGQLIATWRVTEGGSLVGGVSRKTRFPALKDRFSGGLGSVVPNPSLEAEYANHFELGYEQIGDSWSAKLSLYKANLRDAIESVTLPASACAAPSPNCSQLRNVGRQRNQGFELSGQWQALDTLGLSAQFSLVDRENLSAPALLPTGTPRETFRVAANWRFLPEWRANVDLQHESKRYSTTNGARVADAFTLVNSFVRFAPNEHWGVEVGGRNLTNELYAYEEGFFEAGRSWLLQLDWRY